MAHYYVILVYLITPAGSKVGGGGDLGEGMGDPVSFSTRESGHKGDWRRAVVRVSEMCSAAPGGAASRREGASMWGEHAGGLCVYCGPLATWPLTRVHLEVSGPAPGHGNGIRGPLLHRARVAFVGVSSDGHPTVSPPDRARREQDEGCDQATRARTLAGQIGRRARMDDQLVQAG